MGPAQSNVVLEGNGQAQQYGCGLGGGPNSMGVALEGRGVRST